MTKRPVRPVIRLRGVRHNNLKNFDLDLPLRRLIVITGLSGSGKSSLAFDTLFAEGQRRYLETFSPYARQFFDRMDRPQVDRIDGIPPAIALEQRNTVRTTRSTVGTMTELCDHMKVLWPRLAQLHCRRCGRPVRKDSPQLIWETLAAAGHVSSREAPEALVTFDLPLSEKVSLPESLALISKQGYQRLLVNGEIARLDELLPRLEQKPPAALTVIQDRLKLTADNRARLAEAAEHAYHFGKGRLAIHLLDGAGQSACRGAHFFSSHFHCATCDIEYREPTPALFSFNHPIGACPACRGFGRIITIDYHLALPDRSRTLAEGAVKPWQTGHGADCQKDLVRMCRHYGIPLDVPFDKLPARWQDWILHGDPDYGKDEAHEWPRAWYGVKGYFRWLESKAYKMHIRVLLSRYRAYSTCPDCRGQRFQPESLLYRLVTDVGARSDRPPGPGVPAGAPSAPTLSLADFYQLPVAAALKVIEQLVEKTPAKPSEPLALALNEVFSRLRYLVEVGLGYLTLDRPTRTLSGGETQRVNLTACLGARLVNTLFVLDEPSVGLHARDTARLVRVLENLRDASNTVVVVEHDAGLMRAADQIVDLGPGHGEAGGHVVFQGPFKEIMKCRFSLTGQYLSGAKQREAPARRPVNLESNQSPSPRRTLRLTGAQRHNLKHLAVDIPLNRFVCLTGVSGSGKTTLAREVLLPALQTRLRSAPANSEPHAAVPEKLEDAGDPPAPSALRAPGLALDGAEHVGRAVLVDQSALGKTPRSNPAVYLGAFDDIRELFARSDLARRRGLTASAFSFNSSQGQCERCRGAGFEKVEMQFLSDVYLRCPDCNGRRYRPHILEIKLRATPPPGAGSARMAKPRPQNRTREWSIADLLEATVDEAILVFLSFIHTPPGRRALRSLNLLQEVGLGYVRLGQPLNTLSGGESQRLKLAGHLAEFAHADAADSKPTLFLFDEPTTGLHFEDVRVLLKVFQRLVDAGHSVLVIEHNLDVIRSADWLIDLGPEGGEEGGRLVAQGTPEQVAACATSHTGRALRETFRRI
jgi:excinuclease ABC subunit A